jgi:hypothetical protein
MLGAAATFGHHRQCDPSRLAIQQRPATPDPTLALNNILRMHTKSVPRLLDWLKDQLAGVTIEWGDDALSADHPYASRGADPVVAGCPILWPWHIVGPDEPDWQSFGSGTLVLEYDLDVYELWPTGPCSGLLGTWIAELDRPLDVVSTYRLAELRELPGALLVLSGGWRPCDLAGEKSHRWTILYSASDPRVDTNKCEVDQRATRRSLQIAHAHRWARRMRVDPALAWLTPAEARVLAGIGVWENVYQWATEHRIPIFARNGLEPMLRADAVLTLAVK